MSKASLRSLYLNKRAELSPHQKSSMSREICDRFFLDFNIDHYETIHIFLPIIDKNEIDTHLLIRACWDMGKKICVPVMEKEYQLGSALFTADTALRYDQWGVPEPIAPVDVAPEEIDLVFLPLLLFDLKGYRVGYGKGYYDRFICKIRKETLKVGLSFFDPIDAITPIEPWDETMDACVTPSTTHRFSKP